MPNPPLALALLQTMWWNQGWGQSQSQPWAQQWDSGWSHSQPQQSGGQCSQWAHLQYLIAMSVPQPQPQPLVAPATATQHPPWGKGLSPSPKGCGAGKGDVKGHDTGKGDKGKGHGKGDKGKGDQGEGHDKGHDKGKGKGHDKGKDQGRGGKAQGKGLSPIPMFGKGVYGKGTWKSILSHVGQGHDKEKGKERKTPEQVKREGKQKGERLSVTDRTNTWWEKGLYCITIGDTGCNLANCDTSQTSVFRGGKTRENARAMNTTNASGTNSWMRERAGTNCSFASKWTR